MQIDKNVQKVRKLCGRVTKKKNNNILLITMLTEDKDI